MNGIMAPFKMMVWIIWMKKYFVFVVMFPCRTGQARWAKLDGWGTWFPFPPSPPFLLLKKGKIHDFEQMENSVFLTEKRDKVVSLPFGPINDRIRAILIHSTHISLYFRAVLVTFKFYFCFLIFQSSKLVWFIKHPNSHSAKINSSIKWLPLFLHNDQFQILYSRQNWFFNQPRNGKSD
jgi:hypothetical protein